MKRGLPSDTACLAGNVPLRGVSIGRWSARGGNVLQEMLLGRFGDWNVKEVDFLNRVQLISAKPVVYLVNLTEKAYIKKKSKWLPKVGGPLDSTPFQHACCVARHACCLWKTLRLAQLQRSHGVYVRRKLQL